MIFQISRLRWRWFRRKIFEIFKPKFTGLSSPNAGGIVVDHELVRFWLSSSVPEIFVI